MRLGYLLPDVSLEVRDREIVATHGPEREAAAVRKEITHCLYREKIYQETLPMRQQVVDALTRRS